MNLSHRIGPAQTIDTDRVAGVIHFSTSDSGGAFTAAHRIHQAILRLGFASKFFVQTKITKDDRVLEAGGWTFGQFLNKAWNTLGVARKREIVDFCFYDRMSYSLVDYNEIISKLDFHPKVIFIHWISGFLDTNLIARLVRDFDSTVYVTFMDLANLTGGCHYSWDCLGYTKDCRSCPAVNVLGKRLPVRNLRKKIKFVECVEAVPLSSNTWLDKKIQASRVFAGAPIRRFSIGIDSDVFCPGLQQESRNRLRLPIDKRYILVAASSLDDPRKGIQYARLAVSLLASRCRGTLEGVEVLLAGISGDIDSSADWGLPIRPLGWIGGDQALADLYRAADIFLSPSVEDAGPMIVSEVMLCGTPVVSFDIGAACDLIGEEEAGFLVPLRDYSGLADALQRFFALDALAVSSLSNRVRQRAVSLVSLDAEKANLRALLEGCTLVNARGVDA
jgi:glycosyltransferase involved in cell wall biosynthesis